MFPRQGGEFHFRIMTKCQNFCPASRLELQGNAPFSQCFVPFPLKNGKGEAASTHTQITCSLLYNYIHIFFIRLYVSKAQVSSTLEFFFYLLWCRGSRLILLMFMYCPRTKAIWVDHTLSIKGNQPSNFSVNITLLPSSELREGENGLASSSTVTLIENQKLIIPTARADSHALSRRYFIVRTYLICTTYL
ncbi:hypothetical protein BZL39_H01770 [Zygosaccharomyces parabailii]|nr:hypothetical protein BZL39_H01770 [Zygosaccharomyces parabailii]